MIKIYSELQKTQSLAEIFEIVKEAVRRTLGRERGGLMLGLADLGNQSVGGFYPVGSNLIVMNNTLLRLLEDNPQMYKIYSFYVLLHEYLHSLGILDERYNEAVCYFICNKVFGEDSAVTKLAKNPREFLSKLGYLGRPIFEPVDRRIEIVEEFDSENVTYIG